MNLKLDHILAGRVARMAGAALIGATAIFALPGEAPAQLQGQQIAQGQPLSEVIVIGNRRIEAETIRSYLAVRPGDPITEAALNRSVRQLFDTGLFKDAAIAPDGNRLLVQVVENPSINRINIEGNRSLDDEVLTPLLASRPRRPFTRSAAEADAQLLTESYRRIGRYAAKVEPVIIELPDNRVDLVFEVTEGEITEVQAITFVGNEEFSDSRLRDVIETSETGFLSAFVSTDIYDPDRLEFDKQLLRQYYLTQGYADFAVLSAVTELSPDQNGFYITFTVDEGEVYTFGEFDAIVSAKGLDEEKYLALLPDLAGETYDSREVEAIIDAITSTAGQDGFAFVEVRPQVRRNDEDRVLDITFELIEGRRIYVERIDIEGNDRTLDRVIRRQFDIVEGDAFNARSIDKARARIRGLGFFGNVAVRTERGQTDDRAYVKVEVEEQPTGSLSLGAGFSSASGPLAEISISEANFLGRGQFVRARVVASGDSQVYDLTFREPAFLDRDLALGLNIAYSDEDLDSESSFELTQLTFSPSLAFPISERGRLKTFYELSQVNIRPDNGASAFILADDGREYTSAIGATYTYDLRNDPIETTEGYLFTFTEKVAGFGGSSRFSSSVAKAKGWTSFFENEVIASLEVEGGAVVALDGDLRITDRKFLGGDSFRGFAFAGVGPRDFATDDALGGNYYAVARSEVTFPLGLPEEVGIYGGLFMDVGSLWHLDRDRIGANVVDDGANLRASIGASIFWASLVGPLRLNFAVPLKEVTGDDKEFFRLTVGTRF
ncbi:MAG: outer membrane protein assembly factor BamA [Pikeienuella sp.]